MRPIGRSLSIRAVATASHPVVAGGLRERGAERVSVSRPASPRSRHPRPQPTGPMTTPGGPMLRPGICSVTYRDLPPEEIVPLAAEAGLECIEWGGDVHVAPGVPDLARSEERRVGKGGSTEQEPT